MEDGVVELYTSFEGNEFVLERLYRGSSMNYRAFFMEDLMYVFAKCVKHSVLLELNQKTFDSIKTTHPDFEKAILSY
jgi:CRP-like cAMP-binding protein